MILEEIEKSRFAQINDKRYYFSYGLVSLPFSYPFLNKLSFLKEKKSTKVIRFYNRKTQTFSNGKIFNSKAQNNFNL